MNRLAAHVTPWRAWYAVLAVPAFLLGSFGALLSPPVSFVLFAALALLFIALASRRPPTPRDLGLCRGLSPRDGIVVLAVFAVTHLVFWALGRVSGQSGQAEALFAEMALDGPLLPAFVVLFSSVVLAPVCEEILYRGVVLRPIHDHLARRGRASTGAAAGIAASTLLFAMPHLATDTLDIMALGYLVTGIGLGLTYVLTGSLTATMIGHSLQSTVAFAQILLLGRGDADVHPLLWALVLGGPLWVWLGARAVRAVLPRGEATRKIFE